MKPFQSSLVVLALLAGCAAPEPPDPIGRLSAWLTNTPPGEAVGFPNGPWAPINLAATAPVSQLVAQALGPDDTTHFTIVEVRKIQLIATGMEGIGNPSYTAVLVDTHAARKIALLQFDHGAWISRVYDTKDLPNQAVQATAATPRS